MSYGERASLLWLTMDRDVITITNWPSQTISQHIPIPSRKETLVYGFIFVDRTLNIFFWQISYVWRDDFSKAQGKWDADVISHLSLVLIWRALARMRAPSSPIWFPLKKKHNPCWWILTYNYLCLRTLLTNLLRRTKLSQRWSILRNLSVNNLRRVF